MPERNLPPAILMNESTQDRRALFLLLSMVFYLVLSAFVTKDRVGEIVLALAMYGTVIAAVLDSSVQRDLRWPALLLAGCSMLGLLARVFYPTPIMLGLGWASLAAFFGFVSVSIFANLGRAGPVTRGRLYASVSLYLMLGTFYFSVFNLLEVTHPGSFAEGALPALTGISPNSLLYFSMVTLTTLGYGDILPVSPPARMLAALEAATGVLYIAITVARLVSAYQKTRNN
jgi:hypothetical protein